MNIFREFFFEDYEYEYEYDPTLPFDEVVHQIRAIHIAMGDTAFLATLVALHFTPVSESVSKWVGGQSFGLA